MIRIISYAEAAECISLPTWVNHDTTFLLHEGDAYLHEHLWLDYGSLSIANWCKWCNMPYTGDDHQPGGVIVTGNLTVVGGILNTDADSGPSLFVVGDCYAKNLIAGGADIEIESNAYIDGIVYAFYNHGELIIYRELHASIYINDDHMVSVGSSHLIPQGEGKKKAKNYTFSIDSYQIPDHDANIPSKLKKLLSPRLQLWGDILSALSRGEDVLIKPGETLDTIQDSISLVLRNPDVLRKVPKSLQTAEFFKALFVENTPLDALTIVELVGRIPKSALTQDVLTAALQLSPKCFLRLPMSFDLTLVYEQCFLQLKDPKKVFDEIPEQYRTPVMQVFYDTF